MPRVGGRPGSTDPHRLAVPANATWPVPGVPFGRSSECHLARVTLPRQLRPKHRRPVLPESAASTNPHEPPNGDPSARAGEVPRRRPADGACHLAVRVNAIWPASHFRSNHAAAHDRNDDGPHATPMSSAGAPEGQPGSSRRPAPNGLGPSLTPVGPWVEHHRRDSSRAAVGLAATIARRTSQRAVSAGRRCPGPAESSTPAR
jgi:hypothetical protein